MCIVASFYFGRSPTIIPQLVKLGLLLNLWFQVDRIEKSNGNFFHLTLCMLCSLPTFLCACLYLPAWVWSSVFHCTRYKIANYSIVINYNIPWRNSRSVVEWRWWKWESYSISLLLHFFFSPLLLLTGWKLRATWKALQFQVLREHMYSCFIAA